MLCLCRLFATFYFSSSQLVIYISYVIFNKSNMGKIYFFYSKIIGIFFISTTKRKNNDNYFIGDLQKMGMVRLP